MAVTLTIDHRLRIPIGAIPRGLDDDLIDALCIPNLAREEAKDQHVWGWKDMPEELVLYGLTGPRDNAVLDMPRGFLPDLAEGFRSAGIDFDVDDHRACPAVFRAGNKLSEREHQGAAIQAILDAEHGIYQAPPGSGKTVAVLQAGRRSGTRCCIVVNNKDIMYQWVDRIHEHLGFPLDTIGVVGDGKFVLGHIWTIATVQTLSSRFDQLEEDGFFDHFGFVCVDECHHAQADTYLDVLNRFSAKYRIGVSATPKKTGDFLLAQMVLGPIIHITTHKGLIDKGYLIKPQIVQVKTNFKHRFKSTTSRWSRSNYPEVLVAVLNDPERNAAIVSTIMRESGHHCLVLTKRYDHIDILESMLRLAGYEFEIARLTGKQSTGERDRVIKLLNNEPCCVFSTLAEEALDVPRVDRGWLVYPQKNVGLIEQELGRFERSHPDKKDAIVYDFADIECGPFKAQWTARYSNLYKRRGLKIHRKTVKDYV